MPTQLHRMMLGPRAKSAIGSAAFGNLYVGTEWDLDATESSMNSLLSGFASNIGTTVKPTEPTLPQGSLTNVNAGNSTDLASAANTGSRNITLTANCTGIASIHNARDVRINLAGYTIDTLRLDHGSTADAAQRVHIVGPGKIGFLAKLFNLASAADILVDGVRLSIEYQSTPDTTQYPIIVQASTGGVYGVQRMGIIHSIVRGTASVSKAAAGYLHQCQDVVFYDCNIAAGLNAPSPDDWGIRSDSSTRVWFVDSYIRGGSTKPAIRGDDMDSWVTWSTPGVRGTDRMLTLMNRYTGNIDPSLDNDGAHDTFGIILRLFNRWISANESGSGAKQFGPNSGPLFTTDYYLAGGLVIRSESSSWFAASHLADVEAAADVGETWDLDCLSGTPNTYTHANPIDSLVPAWPSITGGASNSTSFSVGSDPFVD